MKLRQNDENENYYKEIFLEIACSELLNDTVKMEKVFGL